jgi:hypothetical protein
MEIQNFKFVQRGHLIGQFDILIPKWELTIKECSLFEKGHHRWVSLPTRSFDGQDGKKAYVPIVKFGEKVFDRLQAAALAKIDDFLTGHIEPTMRSNHGN